jgi:hypothetical protein
MRVSIGELPSAIKDVLKNMSDETEKQVAQITADVAREGATMVDQEAKKAYPNGRHYSRSWTSDVDTRVKVGSGYVIHSKKPYYRLGHLLENGHVVKNGTGRIGAGKKHFVSGKAHISVAEKEIENLYVEKIEEALKK